MNNKMKRAIKRNLVGYAFILPNFIGLFIFTLLPIIFVFGLSFMEWDSAHPAQFIGVDNFIRMFGDSTFKISIGNTFYYAFGTVPFTLMASLGLAMILNKKLRGKNIFRTLFFFPYVASLIAYSRLLTGPISG